MSVTYYKSEESFQFENGSSLEELSIAYHTYGTLNENKDNVVWVCHALTANSDVFDWWPGLFGEGELFNPEQYFIVCANVLGSHYGTSNPLSINPTTGKRYFLDFPQFTIRDIVRTNQRLADHLGIKKIEILIGGSLGGQQVLEWVAEKTIAVNRLIVIGSSAQASPWGIAFNESQRLAISADPTFYEQTPTGGANGLKAARSIALLSYRNYQTYTKTQQETEADKVDQYRASSYQQYQGDKLVNRFDAYSYWYLTKAMDSHNLGRGRNSVEETLQDFKTQTLVVGIPTDLLFPATEQEFIAQHIPGASYYALDSFYGHDGFLIETKTLTDVIGKFLQETATETQKEAEKETV
ncbi:homoserine O-acetyltransferase family protein [Sphingobacterium sp. MYb382]|uniref:homoserine O-acetyltransferase family protein n=1 Tax=Sphingobacterium sp. MYb382 TaxID=2745278 RepID=UPI0030B6710F